MEGRAMKLLVAAALCLFAGQASAESKCGIYTSNVYEPGQKTVTFSGEGHFRIIDKTHGSYSDDSYSTFGAGTDVSYSAGHNDKDANDIVFWIGYQDIVIIDMELFTPYCVDK
jgi:hypothetical protein